ncbi:FadR family transcriptional regulator [Candidatus Aerophobetes bacterium]|nr:FadR family transcriptional regulator [Candidatus Aerophobetes bacterium]
MNKIKFPRIASRNSVVEQIIGEVKKAILEEQLSLGDKLPSENILAEMFGVSRGPIREALTALRVAGVLEAKQGGGTRIRERIPLSPMAPLLFGLLLQEGSPVEAFELREMLEIGTLEITMDKVEEADFEKMQKTIEQLKADLNEGITDSKLLAHHNLDFHYAFAKATHNELIVELTQAFWEVFSFSVQKSMQRRKDIQRAIRNHTAILQALKKKDINKGKEAIKQAVRDWEVYGILPGRRGDL